MICAASICTAISELSSFKHPTRLGWKQMSTITVSERTLRTNAWRNEKLLARASFAVGFPMTLFLCRFKVVMSMAITASDTVQCQRYRDYRLAKDLKCWLVWGQAGWVPHWALNRQNCFRPLPARSRWCGVERHTHPTPPFSTLDH